MGGVIHDDDVEKMRGKMQNKRKSVNTFRANLVLYL